MLGVRKQQYPKNMSTYKVFSLGTVPFLKYLSFLVLIYIFKGNNIKKINQFIAHISR